MHKNIFLLIAIISSSLMFIKADIAIEPTNTIKVTNDTDHSLNIDLTLPANTLALIQLKNLKAQNMLYEAILNNSSEGIIRAIQAGADINKEIKGKKPLLLAVRLKRADALLILLEYGARVDETLVGYAIGLRDIKSAVLLAIKGNVNLNAIYSGKSLLQHSLNLKDVDSSLLLIESGARIAKASKFFQDTDEMELALRIGGGDKFLELIQSLISIGYNIHSCNHDQNIWFLISKISEINSESAMKPVVDLMIKNGASPDQIVYLLSYWQSNRRHITTPLIIAGVHSHALFQALKDAGADVEQKAYCEYYDCSKTMCFCGTQYIYRYNFSFGCATASYRNLAARSAVQ